MHSYIQNLTKMPRGLWFQRGSFILSHCKALKTNNPRGGAIFDHSIFVKPRITMLHTEHRSVGFSEKKTFFMYFPLWPIADNDIPGAGPLCNPGAWLAGFITMISKCIL